MANTTKDTIYIDIDDEITGIIDKVRSSPQKIVALVLPKRATVLQSVVNMKLLKRAADDVKKRVVLVTSESGLISLAGVVGMFVAKTLQSKPEIPELAEDAANAEAIEEIVAEPSEVADETAEPELDPKKSVGELAKLPVASNEPEEVELDEPDSEVPEAAAIKETKTKKNKKLKIPNFNRFRLWLFLGAFLLIVLIVGWILAFQVMPKASVIIKTNATTVNSNLNLTLSTAAKSVDTAQMIVPAKLDTTKKTQSQQVPATGQKDEGTKASGTMTITNCTDSAVTVPAGTGVSASNLTFITQKTLQLDSGNFDSSKKCKTTGAHIGTTSVVAQNNGDQYNLSARTYSVAGFSGLSASGSDMTGGTSKLVKVVSGQDIETAKQKIAGQTNSTVADDLKKTLNGEGYQGIAETMTTGEPAVTTSPNVGDQADQVTVASTITYTMYGAKTADLKTLLDNDIKKQIDTNKQSLADDGLGAAVFKVTDVSASDNVKVNLQTVAKAGAQINQNDLKKQIAGKKKGDAVAIIQNRPGIQDVTINYSPFWVFSMPHRTSHITITIQQTNTNGNKQ